MDFEKKETFPHNKLGDRKEANYYKGKLKCVTHKK